MRTPDLELLEDELVLLRRIEFGSRDLDRIRASLSPMADLSKRLLARGAIPASRLSYFTDPECNPSGKGRSRFDIFEKNGTRGDEIFEHPHFMAFLEYFIFGPKLPPAIIEEFKEAASTSGNLDSEDIGELIPLAKACVRASPPLQPSVASEEFFKLARECGAQPFVAQRIRTAIRALRVRPHR